MGQIYVCDRCGKQFKNVFFIDHTASIPWGVYHSKNYDLCPECGSQLKMFVRNEMGHISDGYHTFDELYDHRAKLFSIVCFNYRDISWKSKKHADGTMYDGMFIVGIDTPKGQATYHYDIDPYWDIFDVKELESAPAWDGHSPDDAISRLMSLVKKEKDDD